MFYTTGSKQRARQSPLTLHKQVPIPLVAVPLSPVLSPGPLSRWFWFCLHVYLVLVISSPEHRDFVSLFIYFTDFSRSPLWTSTCTLMSPCLQKNLPPSLPPVIPPPLTFSPSCSRALHNCGLLVYSGPLSSPCSPPSTIPREGPLSCDVQRPSSQPTSSLPSVPAAMLSLRVSPTLVATMISSLLSPACPTAVSLCDFSSPSGLRGRRKPGHPARSPGGSMLRLSPRPAYLRPHSETNASSSGLSGLLSGPLWVSQDPPSQPLQVWLPGLLQPSWGAFHFSSCQRPVLSPSRLV